MKDRIQEFINKNGLTPTKLADYIGVQRSTVSHLLSGRNKPSFDFISKMLVAYPSLNPDWLITGRGYSMRVNNSNDTEKISNPSLFPEFETENINSQPNDNKIGTHYSEPEKADNKDIIPYSQPTMHSDNNANGKTIERTLIFYTDGTFTEYRPS
jgi:transcriptional regulator with XRE-family HTH domain